MGRYCLVLAQFECRLGRLVLQGSFSAPFTLVLVRTIRTIYPHEWQKVRYLSNSMFPASRRIVRNIPSSLLIFVQPWLNAFSFALDLAFVQRFQLLFILFFTAVDRGHSQWLIQAWNSEPDSVTPEAGAVTAMLRCFFACVIAALAHHERASGKQDFCWRLGVSPIACMEIAILARISPMCRR